VASSRGVRLRSSFGIRGPLSLPVIAGSRPPRQRPARYRQALHSDLVVRGERMAHS
jgi:hypothetical protein